MTRQTIREMVEMVKNGEDPNTIIEKVDKSLAAIMADFGFLRSPSNNPPSMSGVYSSISAYVPMQDESIVAYWDADKQSVTLMKNGRIVLDDTSDRGTIINKLLSIGLSPEMDASFYLQRASSL